MKKLIIGLLIGLLAGGFVGFAGGIFVFPYLFPPPEVNETVSGKTQDDIVATGTFIHADPSDSVHYGSGGVTVYNDLIHLGENFNVGPGPKYHVFLVPDTDVTPSTKVEETKYVDLGRLKSFSGSQNYAIPEGVNPKQFGSVVVWCEQFDVLITPATLMF
ncbi:MAG: DM13 domain-containing protein [Pseudomonadota bacterium]